MLVMSASTETSWNFTNPVASSVEFATSRGEDSGLED